MTSIKSKQDQRTLLNNVITISFTVSSFLFMANVYAGGLTPGATMLATVAMWLKGIGVIVCTIALMIAGYKFLFQQARLQDVANIVIGGILIGSAAIIAGLIMA
ncbi:TrbC/VirB2 family protein [Methylotenera sp.]|jgi:type IV secretion system protein VirB2|uniref:TrbC/VirB2 family protein n=1 Tax=Methylotenera sp. TaxID=2051956 RepID=UPI0027215959|nr:TrbC/VirB2 family protein [Methylotenera sp.]MDO9205614.1 TrbC/VirB2 family protein [Methylotenera sp.]MDP2071823.1 TrbC/VirB2 family protein [Methylotenera sp.]